MMRNDTNPIEPNKYPNVFKDELELRLNSINKSRSETVSKKKSENSDICNRKDVRDSIQKAKLQFSIPECPELNKNHILELNKRLLENPIDSKICENRNVKKNTSTSISCIKTNLTSDTSIPSKDSLKRPIKDNGNIHKVSFKTKNFSKKPVYNNKISTINNSTVASLTQKFNQIIKENDLGTKNSKTSVVFTSKKKSECVNVKLGKNNTFIIQKPSTSKRSSSVTSFDKVNANSPILRKKVHRVKSDSTEKKNILRRKRPECSSNSFNGSSKSSDQNNQLLDVKSHVKRPTFKIFTTRHTNNVRATIQKFECAKTQNSSNETDSNLNKNSVIRVNIENISDKPKIPEKKVYLHKTKNLVIRDGKPKIKLVKSSSNEIKTINKSNSDKDSKEFIKSKNNILESKLKKENDEKLIDAKKELNNGDFLNSCEDIEIKNNIKDVKLNIENAQNLSDSKKICNVDSSNDGIYNFKKINIISEEEYLEIENEQKGNFCDQLTSKMQPNQSFLWRNSYIDQSGNNKINSSFHYDIPVSKINNTEKTHILSLYEPSYLEIFQKVDKIIECNKKKIANDVKKEKNSISQEKIVEAVNSNIQTSFEEEVIEAINRVVVTEPINITGDILISQNDDEDYEIFDNFSVETVSDKTCHLNEKFTFNSKTNCPLPEVPHDNIYQCVSDEEFYEDEENSNLNTYEYCHKSDKRHSNNLENIYEYCKSDENISSETVEMKPKLPERKICEYSKEFSIAKSNSIASSVGYEKISSIYEKLPGSTPQNTHSESFKQRTPECVMSYDSYNSDENIYDTIKQSDSVSISNCYESIPESPRSVTKNHRKTNMKSFMLTSNSNHIPFDSISNFSQSCSGSIISSDQKTNSIYGQRSIASLDTSTIVSYGKAPSEISSSDRSDDWEDLTDTELTNGSNTIVIVRERTRGRHSPASWSRKVRHHWNKSSKKDNDMDSGSEGEHLYESLSFNNTLNSVPQNNLSDDDTDSFESNSDTEQHQNDTDPNSKNSRLPDPPISNSTYTLTRIANKMKKIKENFTKSARKKSNTDSPKLQSPCSETNQNVPWLNNKSSTQKNTNECINKNNDNNQTSFIDINTKQTTTEKSPLSIYKTIFFNSNDSKSSSRQNSNNDENDEKSISTKIKTENQNNKKNYLSFKSFRKSESVSNNSKKDNPDFKRTNSTFYVDDIIENNDKLKSEENLSQSLSKLSVSPQLIAKKNSVEEDEANIKINENGTTNNIGGKKNLSINLIKTPISKISTTRPNAPPPPPPDREDKIHKRDKKVLNSSSWYSDCDISRSQDYPKLDSNGIQKNRASALSWYAEIGLYQPSNISTSSGTSSNLSGSGTCSTSAAFSSPSTPIPPIGMFNHEPLYQFYDASKLESVYRDIDEDFEMDADVYEEIADDHRPQRPSAMALINPKKSPSRTLWCEVPEVIKSAILNTLTEKERKVQEAKFELITSEASYFNSLIVLESHFINHPAFRDEKLITKNDKQILFGNVNSVKKCSERFLADLETCWQNNILLDGLSKIIKNHAEKYFSVYINYCEHQNQLVKTLKKLKSDGSFSEIIYQLQTQPECQSLSLDSFLLLPMQRITRLPLLVDAVLKNIVEKDSEYQQYADSLAILNNVVNQCNEAARNFERKEEMVMLNSQIEFPPHMQNIQLIASDEKTKPNSKLKRWLVKSGDLTHLTWRSEDQSKLTFGKKIQKTTVYLFVFTDFLIITKKKGMEDKYTVIDYCKRSLIEITSGETMAQSQKKDIMGKFTILLSMLENFERKTVEMLLCCKCESDRQRWMEACSLPSSENPNEVIYEDWDQPQVAALYSYQPMQPDELSLQRGDIVHVNKKIADGWYHGERMRDGESGWFPGNYTIEIESAHVRDRNIKQRYRLLDLSGSYLNQQKKKAL